MSDGIPFGASAPSFPGGMDPDQLAALLRALQGGQVPDQPTPQHPVDSPLVAALGGAPSMLGSQMPTPQMPTPQQDAPPAQIPSMLGARPPAMQPAPVPQATGAIPKPPAASPQGEDADEAPAPAARAVPLPPARPAEFTSLADAAGPPANSFDPLTGQPVHGSPKPIAPAPQAAPAADASPGFLSILSNPRVYNTLLGIGSGILQGKNFGEGLGQGIETAQRLNAQQATSDLAQLKAQREQAALGGNVAIYRRFFPNATPEEALAGSQNSTIMTELMKRGLPATETYRQETDDKGNQWQVNTANGQRSLLKSADEDKTVAPLGEEERARMGLPPGVYQKDANGKISTVAQAGENKTVAPLTEEERVRLGLPAGSYQRDANGKISPINPTGTTINMGAEKAQDATVGKAYGDYQVDLATKGRNAANTLNSLALMEQAMKTPGFYSGVGGEGVKRANQFLAALGVKDPRAASATEVFDALSNKVVLDGLGGSLGPGISNTDRDYIARTAPTLAQSQQGNSDLIGIARTLAQRQQAVSKLAREYAASNGGRLDSGFDAKLEEYAAQNPLFPQAAAGANAAPPREAPQGAPAGARQAPDGKWYVSDPNRPGKYLQVR